MSAAEGATDGTLSGALELLTGSVRDLQSELEKELSGKDISSFRAPETLTQAYADAQATQQALVDAGMSGRKRKEMEDASDAIKSWAKAPGESLVDGDVAPFLAYNEEHFRHVNPADVANLVPQGPTKLEDDLDFRIPALGRYYVLGASPSRARSSSATPAFFSDRRGGAVAPSPSSHPPTADETPPRTFHLRRVGGRGRPGS